MAGKRMHNEDNKLDTFRRICDEIAGEPSYLKKAEKLQRFFERGTSGKGFEGDTLLWVQFLIPAANQRPQAHSKLYLQEVEQLLLKLVERTKEDEQTELLQELCTKATDLDLRTFIRLVKHDLRINARARHILDAFGPEAYPAYQSSRDLFAGKENKKDAISPAKKAKKVNLSGIQVMTPISPMLASACKSVEEAFKKSPAGLYSEIKYDGERVQIHKQGDDFKFFSRNLKPVIRALKEYIPRAFPGGGEMILDSEIILVDTDTGALLPFGSLGAHKKQTFANAAVCLFVFDCILYDGEDLTQLPFRKRREILEQNIKPIKSHVQLSESEFLKTKRELAMMTAKVLHANLEGVVKKDYLFDGKMADTADLVVLGAWYGSGKKGGVLSIFLMGCYDATGRLWKTVTKVHSGLDDATNAEVHGSLIKLTERVDANITGAEFTKSEAHSASGISIRFPRITRLRSDKSAKEANDLAHLEDLFEASKKNVNVDLLLANCGKDEDALNVEKNATKIIFWTLGSPNEPKRSSIMLWEFLALFAIAFGFFYRWATANNDFFKNKGLPYAKPILYFGNMYEMFLRRKSMFDIVCDLYTQGGNFSVAKEAVDCLNQDVQETDMDMKDYCTRFTNDVIASTAFGLQVNSFKDRENTFYQMGKKLTTFSFLQNIKFMLFFALKNLNKILKVEIFDKKSTQYFVRLVLDAMKYRQEHNIIRPDMINMLMEARGLIQTEKTKTTVVREWSDRDIVAQCFTSAVLMCFTAHELMENEDVQQKLYEEVQQVDADLEGKELTYEAIMGMKYLDQVVSEVLRKWPAAIAVDRECNKISPTSDENKDTIQPFTYYPFGLGQRNCIGSRFALLEAKAVIYYLLKDYRFAPAAKSCIPLELASSGFQLAPKTGFWVKLIKRNQS
ncbi:hypothetical protein M5D96_003052 [Drosophila gunungcola]|uniref:DNA ligase n=1 Tax=Drosophila gunungcola TaxID=103775 RepID=A0A9P9Z233_9MUSC|nr:hypothetical protein M5D96_003052 [Drosophila gunungcola]